jgi:hypothetical protein
MYALHYIEYKNVDKLKWEDLVSDAPNSLIFNKFDYLSAFCIWDAIILGDYEGAIALPRRTIFGFRKLYQPPFIQKCNWFGIELNPDLKAELWQILKSKYTFINFNSNLPLHSLYTQRVNLILPITTLSENQKRYSKSLRKNIAKAISLNVKVDHKMVAETIKFYINAYGHLNKQIDEETYEAISNLVADKPEMFLNVTVMQDDQPVASLLFATSNKRLHYIMGAPNELGRKLNALSFGLNEVVAQYQNQNFILDFEGSMIPSVKDYYLSFGSYDEPFYEIKWSSYWLSIMLSAYNKLKRS